MERTTSPAMRQFQAIPTPRYTATVSISKEHHLKKKTLFLSVHDDDTPYSWKMKSLKKDKEGKKKI